MEGLVPLDALVSDLNKLHNELRALTASKSAPPRPSDSSAAADSSKATVEVAFEALVQAAEALCQQSRTFYFLLQDDLPAAEHIAGCASDLAHKISLYDSWVRALCLAAIPAVRRSIGPDCCRVHQQVATLVAKARLGKGLRPGDMALVEEATQRISSLEVSGRACCKRLLFEHGRIVADALRELRASIAEAGVGAGDDADDEDGMGAELSGAGAAGASAGDDDDDDELLANATVAAPLESLVGVANEALRLGAVAGADGADADVVLSMLIACGQALSQQVDQLVCAVDDEDALNAVCEHAGSLAKIVRKLLQVLGTRCGDSLRDDASRARLAEDVDKALTLLHDARAAAASTDSSAAAAVEAMSIS